MEEFEILKKELKAEIQKDELYLNRKKEFLQTIEESGVCIYKNFEEEKYKGNDRFVIDFDILQDSYFIRQTKNLTLKDFNFNLECENLDVAIFFYNLLNQSL